MTKLYIFTGFLGSGKTTLLLELMRKLEDRKIGVIQNEFGRIGIDGEILKRDGIEMMELNRGSIFCTCLKLHFVDALSQMAQKNFDYLFVESSGVGDPSNVDEILSVVKETKGVTYDFSGVLCLVDAVNFLDQLAAEETVARQIKHCHLAVISKTDLVDDARILEIKKKIREINPLCLIEVTEHGNLNPDFMTLNLLDYQFAESEPTLNSPETIPKALMIHPKAPVDKQEFETFALAVADRLHRLKGFVDFKDEGWQQVDLVGETLDYKPCDAKEEQQLVIISKIGPKIIRPVLNEWQTNVKAEMELKN